MHTAYLIYCIITAIQFRQLTERKRLQDTGFTTLTDAIVINRATFGKIFDSSFWDTLSDSIVPYAPGEKPSNKKLFLDQIFSDISTHQYTASMPRDYIVYNKYNYVARIVPVFLS